MRQYSRDACLVRGLAQPMWDAVGQVAQHSHLRVLHRKEVWVLCTQDLQLPTFLPCQCTLYTCPSSLSLGSVPSHVFCKTAFPAQLMGSLLYIWLLMSAGPPRCSAVILLILSAHSFIAFHIAAVPSISCSSAVSQMVVSLPPSHSQETGGENSTLPYFLPTALNWGSVLLGIRGRQCRTWLRVVQPRGEGSGVLIYWLLLVIGWKLILSTQCSLCPTRRLNGLPWVQKSLSQRDTTGMLKNNDCKGDVDEVPIAFATVSYKAYSLSASRT